jgi:mitotic spindle assembly checkpoint protein MAD2B
LDLTFHHLRRLQYYTDMAPKKTTTPTNYISLVAHFLDFLTVAFHTILYERNIYPKESFIAARKYNYPVRQSRHPDVCEWINDTINHIEVELMSCSIEKISLIILSRWDDPLERFVFDLSRFPIVKKQDWYTVFAKPDPEGPKLPVVNIAEEFRAVMAKLAFCHRELEPLPDDCHFNVSIELRDEADPPIGHPQPWVPAVPSLQREKETEDWPAKEGEDLVGVSTTPIRLVDAGPMSFEMWAEETRTKVEALDRHLYDQGDEFDEELNRVYEEDFEPLGDQFARAMQADEIERGQQKMPAKSVSVQDEDEDSLEEYEYPSQISFDE